MAIDSTHRQLYRTLVEIIDTMNCGLVGRDREGIITFVNDRLLAWLGYAREEFEGHPAALFFPPEVRQLAYEEMKAVDEGDLRTRLSVLQRRDSTTFPVLFIPQRMHDKNGNIVGGFAVVVDMGGVQTAKRAGYPGGEDVRERLNRIVMELQNISLSPDLAASRAFPLHHEALRDLSGREKEVLAQLITGERVSGIAQTLHISPHTVRNHLKAIFHKLDVKNQADLIRYVRSLEKPVAQGRRPRD